MSNVTFQNPGTLIFTGERLIRENDSPDNKVLARKTVAEMRELIKTAQDAVSSGKMTQKEINNLISPDHVNTINTLVPQLVNKYGLEYSKAAKAGLFTVAGTALVTAASWFHAQIPTVLNSGNTNANFVARGVNATLEFTTKTVAPKLLEVATATSWGKIIYVAAAGIGTGLALIGAHKYFNQPQEKQKA